MMCQGHFSPSYLESGNGMYARFKNHVDWGKDDLSQFMPFPVLPLKEESGLSARSALPQAVLIMG